MTSNKSITEPNVDNEDNEMDSDLDNELVDEPGGRSM